MSSTAALRRDSGGCIDRSKPLKFTFNGKSYTGYRGDTLASALIANGIMLTARSFRYHRPRGIFSAGIEECHALLAIGEGRSREPNVRATRQPLYDGLIANSQNGWPSLKWDLASLPGWLSGFLPTGFYYKTFMWPNWKWYEGLVRRMAGVARAPAGTDPDRYEKQHVYCELLIIGAGPAGLAAALAAASAGYRIILVDDQPEFGGSLLWDQAQVEGIPGFEWARQAAERLAALEQVTLLPRTTVVAAWDHGYVTAIEQRDPDASGQTTQRLWKIRSRRTVLASGAIERPLVFPDNDRPGIMLADSARQYLNRYAVRAGHGAVVYTNNDSAYRAALDLHAHSVSVQAIVDVRENPQGDLPCRARELGMIIYDGHEISGTSGYFRIRQIKCRPVQNNGNRTGRQIRLKADLLCISGGWNPTLHLLSQAGGKLEYDEKLACYLPRLLQPVPAQGIQPAGSANGASGLAASLAGGHEAGLDAIEHLGGEPARHIPAPAAANPDETYAIEPHWTTQSPCKGRQWVDYLHDVTSKSIEIAVLEGFVSVEHLKRYTTVGMAADQGKTANVNALAILAELIEQPLSGLGATTFRPPYHPVTLGALAGRETGPRAWPMRLLPLHDWHVAAGGVMEDHSGWHRSACYRREGESEARAIRREVLAARNGVTLFDSSSLGKLEISGPDAARFLNRMYINNVETLKQGRVRYGMMLNENGVIIDDGVFARLEEDFFLVSTSSAGSTEVSIAFEEWLQTEWPELDVLVNNASTQWATLTVGGPHSRQVIGQLLPGVNVSAETFPHMAVLTGDLDGLPYRLMRVSFTGEISFELSIPAGYALAAWEQLLRAGESLDITPLGMEALDVLRTEKGYLEVGVDTDVTTSPLDVGWAVTISKKSADFIGKRSLSRPNDLRQDRLQLVGLIPRDVRQFIPVGSHIISPEGRRAEGHVTSSCISPTLQRSIAMAMLKSGHTRRGEIIMVDVENRQFEAEVAPLSFFDSACERLKL